MQRVSIRVTGVVQGVGFRPFAYQRAAEMGLTGFVGNDSSGVFLEVQGPAAAITQLLTDLQVGPPLAVVQTVSHHEIPMGTDTSFRIVDSTPTTGVTSIPPDVAVCGDCLDEMRDPADRRFGYPFIACTNCGPRYTIVETLPYDRPGTTMADFPLCPDCAAEYEDPLSRRFHAQPTACPACGPRLGTAVSEIVSALLAGRIVAIKGVGGYHLACDAGSIDAVSTLRARKQRGDKPLAVMVRDEAVARECVHLDDTALTALTSAARPIVLAPSSDSGLQARVAPGNGYVGVMLPYAPLHHLLFDAGAPPVLVMTSGNVSDEPICITVDEADVRLAALADLLVHHDRRIHVACDDSVLRASGGHLQPVRRSRGYAPLPITFPVDAPPLLAVGGELKTTIAIAQGRQAWLSQHIGDTGTLETLAALARTVETLTDLQRVDPTAIVSDRHPGYLSRRWAGEEAARRRVPHLTVQHHHAHLASLLAEHQWDPTSPVLGFTFDGTGYGTDGTIWGGELLLGTYASVDRVGHLRAIALPGGDAAVRRPLRTAVAHLMAAGIPADAVALLTQEAEPNELAVVSRMVATGSGCTPTTSMGRLFDAIASLLAIRQSVDYEGQAAIEMEALAATAPRPPEEWRIAADWDGDAVVLDPSDAVRAAVAATVAGMPPAISARAFHEAVADAVVRSAALVRERTGVTVVGLTGGVFANSVLTAACQGRLGAAGFTVLTHRLVPPNDGGLALGQVAVAAGGGASTAEGSA